MAIQKHNYELSIWNQKLVNGQEQDFKQQIIGAHDMSHLGRATKVHFKKLLNGTHVVTFSMPTKYFDSEKGKYVQNELIQNLFNEQKIKLFFKEQWYEFNIKTITENKNYKSIMKDFVCSDGFIDELSRTGYDIELDPELNNSVNEVHDFMDIILEDSFWKYRPEWNWGDFTEYREERFYKIPLSIFGGSIKAYKIELTVPQARSDLKIINANTNEKRPLEYGDDLAGQNDIFWNEKGNNNTKLLTNEVTITGDYIYVPMSDLQYINAYLYENLAAAAQSSNTYYDNNLKYYALQPASTNPKDIIQFIYIDNQKPAIIDESSVLTNYNYTYILTVESWDKQNQSQEKVYYVDDTGATKEFGRNKYSINSINWKPVYYDGFLTAVDNKPVTKARRINIANRTELNLYDDIFVEVYNTPREEYQNLLVDNDVPQGEYRLLSKIDTRIILPTLARNIVANGSNITDTNGWSHMKQTLDNIDENNENVLTTLSIQTDADDKVDSDEQIETEIRNYFLKVKFNNQENTDHLINFGFTGSEKQLESDKTYALRIETVEKKETENSTEYITKVNDLNLIKRIFIQKGTLDKDSNYIVKGDIFSFENCDKVLEDNEYLLFKPTITIDNPYIVLKQITQNEELFIKTFEIFEAYTRGKDILENKYLDLRPGEDKEVLSKDMKYNYSGRNITIPNNDIFGKINKRDLLLETDVTLGNAYEKQTYFIQSKTNLKENIQKDTFGDKEKWFEDNDPNFNNTKYVEEDFEYKDYILDLSKCQYFKEILEGDDNECSCSDNHLGFCYYQKFGFCPYLFEKEKHPRRIRTLQQSKSNRFNLIQELSKVFEFYPAFNTLHEQNGHIKRDEDGRLQKYIYFITEKGNQQLVGYRYEKNLSNISRTNNSDNITTKLLVDPVDSEYYDTGYCTIQTAQDNLGKNNYVLDFSYYTQKGLLDPTQIEADLYGIGQKDELAFLPNIDQLNAAYDRTQRRISALTNESYKTLKDKNIVNINGISAALEEKQKIKTRKTKYYSKITSGGTTTIKKTETYKKYEIEYYQQSSRLWSLINELFFTDSFFYNPHTGNIVNYDSNDIEDKNGRGKEEYFWDEIINQGNYIWEDFKKDIIDKHKYKQCGTIGKEEGIIEQVQELIKESKTLLKEIIKLTKKFNQKYEAFLKEGTWSDSNYLTDNEYYWGSISVLEDSCKPQVNYNISVINLEKSNIENPDIYSIDIADTTFIEDIDIFGVNLVTGLPNKEKVIISEIDYDLDTLNDSIGIQNYTTQFEDLFQQITASVQSLTYNENIYKRAQNFTAKHYIKQDSLQGTLDQGNLTLLNVNNNLKLDDKGTEGKDFQNTSSRYKLTGDGLFFSTNGGETWLKVISPKGYNMDYAQFGNIDIGKIRLVDNNYVYFLWDKAGITAYREPQENTQSLVDFTRFNKYGLSLVENNKIRLRAGYNFNGANGNIDTEKLQGNDVGFYLYDNRGNSIFETSTPSGENDDDYNMSARLKLKGEIFVYSDHVIPQSGYKLSNEITNLRVSEEGYRVKNNNTNKGTTYLLSIANGDFTTGGQLSIQSGSRYNFSVLKRYTHNVVENKFPSEASAEDRKNGFNNNAFTGNRLKIRNNDDSIVILDSDNGAIYWYTEFKITAIAKQNITITFDVEQQEHSLFMGNLFNDNEQGEVILNTEPLQNYFNNIEVDNNKLTKANRFFIADKYEEGISNKKEYGNGFDIYSFVQVQGTFEKVSSYNTNIYTCIENNQFVDKNIFIPSSNKYYTTMETSTDISAKTKTAIFINKTKPDNDSDTIKRRIFTIAIKNSNSVVKNMICAFNDGEVVVGGDIMYNNRAYTGELEKLPDDIVVTNGNILVNPIS